MVFTNNTSKAPDESWSLFNLKNNYGSLEEGLQDLAPADLH